MPNGNPTTFGEIDPSTVNVVNEDNNMSSYTMRLTRMSNGIYFDNVVLQEREDGSFETRIIRYRPEADWLANHGPQYPSYDEYNGRIEFYDASGVFIAGPILRDGDVIEHIDLNTDIHIIPQGVQKLGDQNIASEAGGGDTCTIAPTYAGLVQENTFFITDTRYTITCFGAGPSGNPVNGPTGFGNDGSTGGGFGGGAGGLGSDPIIDPDGNILVCEPGFTKDAFGNCVADTASIIVDQILIGTCAEEIINDFVLEDFSASIEAGTDSSIEGLINTVFDTFTGNSGFNLTFVTRDLYGINGETDDPTRNANGALDITLR